MKARKQLEKMGMTMVQEKKIKKIFYIVLAGSLLVFWASVFLTHYNSLQLYVWKPGSSFYDFFSCLKENIYWNRKEIYQGDTIYPPLANFFYMFITRFMSIDTLKQLETLTDYNKIKALQECSLYFVLYCSVTLLAYFMILTSWKKGSKLEKNVFTAAMLFTIPFLYQFERSNIIFVALIFTMLFFLWKDSQNRWLRVLAYCSLAIAAGIKIYPAIFGFMILKEKKWKETVGLVIMGVAVFLIPFIFFGGFENIFYLLQNLKNTSGSFSATRIGCQLDYTTILKNLFSFVGGNCVFIANVLKVTFALLGIWAVSGLRDRWKVTLLLTCLLIGLPSISYVYSAIFMIIPIVEYLDSGDKKKWDVLYLVGMLLVMIPLPFVWMEGAGDKYYSYMHVTTPMWVEGMSIVIMTVLLIGEGIGAFLRKRKMPFAIVILAAIILISAFLNRSGYNVPYAYTDYLSKTVSDWLEVQDGDSITQSFTAETEHVRYAVIKIKPTESGSLTITLKENGNGKLITETLLDMKELSSGYNQILTEGCEVIPGKRYILEIGVKCEKEEKVKLGRTIEYLDTGEEMFGKNGEMLNGALGIQFYEN